MGLDKIKGLKCPDEFSVRFFFKEKLHLRKGSVLELGCANGCNLQLFNDYGWETVGVDLSSQSVSDAEYNFKLTNRVGKFSCSDMLSYVGTSSENKPFDVLLFPSSLYYLKYSEIQYFFRLCIEKKIIGIGTMMFFHMRAVQDYRYGRGCEVEPNCFLIDCEETGEKGCVITFFNEPDFINLLNRFFKFEQYTLLRSNFENIQNKKLIHNSDFIVWGTVDGIK